MAERTETYKAYGNAFIAPPLVGEGQEVTFSIELRSVDRSGNKSAPVSLSVKSLGEVLPSMASQFPYGPWWVSGTKVNGNYWFTDENDAVLSASWAHARDARYLYLMNTPKTGESIRSFLESLLVNGYWELGLTEDQWFIKGIRSVDISNAGYVKIELTPALFNGPFDTVPFDGSQDVTISFSQARAGATGGKGNPGDPGAAGEGFEIAYKLTATEAKPTLPGNTRPYKTDNWNSDGYYATARPTTHTMRTLWAVVREVEGTPAVGKVPDSTFGNWRFLTDEPLAVFGRDGIWQRFAFAATATRVAPPLTQPTDRTDDTYVPPGASNNRTAVEAQSALGRPYLWYSYTTRDQGSKYNRTWSNYVPWILLSVRNQPVQAWYTLVPRHRFVEIQQWQSYTRAAGVETRLPDPPVTWVKQPEPFVPGKQFLNDPTVPQNILFNANKTLVPVSATTPAGSIETGSVLFTWNMRYRDQETDRWFVYTGNHWYYGSPSAGLIEAVSELPSGAGPWEVWCTERYYDDNLGYYVAFTPPTRCGIVDENLYLPFGGEDGQVVIRRDGKPEFEFLAISDVRGLVARLTTIEANIRALQGGTTTPTTPEYTMAFTNGGETSVRVTMGGGPASSTEEWELKWAVSGGSYNSGITQTSNVFNVTGLTAGTTYQFRGGREDEDEDDLPVFTFTTDTATTPTGELFTVTPRQLRETTANFLVRLTLSGGGFVSLRSTKYYLRATGTPVPGVGTTPTGTAILTAIGRVLLGQIRLSGLSASTTYKLYVQNTAGVWQDAVDFTTAATLGKTGGVSVASVTREGATVSWTAVSGATGYQIFVSESSTAPDEGDLSSQALTTTGTSLQISGQFAATAYSVWVSAYASSGTTLSVGAWSDRATFTTTTMSGVSVSGFSITSTTEMAGTFPYKQWTVSWDATTGAQGYRWHMTTGSSPTSTRVTAFARGGGTTDETSVEFSTTLNPGIYIHVQPYAGASNGNFHSALLADT